MVNVKNKRCAECTTGAWYGLPGHPASHCARHHKEGMISHPKRRCVEEECRNLALWGVSVARHCETHRQAEELNLVHQRCASCGLPDLLAPDTQLCDTCDPNALATYRRGRKENVIRRVFEEAGLHFVHDRVVARGCGRERPDFRFDDPAHVTIVEVDENQHRLYSCERARMVNLCQASWKPHVFIRYNPDGFTTAGRARDCDDKYRHRKLLEVLAAARSLPPVEDPRHMLRVVHLFYDGFRRGDPPVFECVSME
jgi:hypothetical protein